MQIEPEIVFHNMDRSAAIEDRVAEHIARLERFHERITSCRVVVDAPHRHGHKGKIYHVRVDLTVPGGEIVADRDPGLNHAHEDVNVAIRDAFAAATRQLEDYVRRHSDHRVKEHPAILHGKVVRLFPEEGYGYIVTKDGREVYFHREACTGGAWEAIDIGSEVRFKELAGKKGPHAVSVNVV